MARRRRLMMIVPFLAALITTRPAPATAVRECLDAAARATGEIELPGDQSAARRCVALELCRLDPRGALTTVATIGRPADAARALAAVACALTPLDAAASQEAVSTAGRLLARIANPARRRAEQRFLLFDLAELEDGALPAAPELTPQEGQAAILTALALRRPAAALARLRAWGTPSTVGDRVRAAAIPRLAPDDPEGALAAVAEIVSVPVAEQTLWAVAERRPPQEAIAIAGRVLNPMVRAGILTSAARRLASSDPDAALVAARESPVSPTSALAEVAAAMAGTNPVAARELARALPPVPRAWTLVRIAHALAERDPAFAEEVLREAAGGANSSLPADAHRLVLARMATADPDRAVRLAQALADQEERESALAAIAAVIAAQQPGRATDLVWSLSSPHWRSRGARAVAAAMAASDPEAALALIGLIKDADVAQQARADIAARIAGTRLQEAERLLSSLPASAYRRQKAWEAAHDLLLAGHKVDDILPLARLAEKPDLGLRWLLPALAQAQQESVLHVAERIQDPYLRSLALVDTARRLAGTEARCRPAPERLAQIRAVVEWETR